MSDMKLNSRYTFDTLAPAILGITLENVKLTAIMSKDDAVKQQGDVITTLTAIKDIVPELRELSADDLTFYKFENQNKETIIIAREYINLSSVVEVNSVNLKILVPNTSSDKIAVLTQLLAEYGFVGTSISTY